MLASLRSSSVLTRKIDGAALRVRLLGRSLSPVERVKPSFFIIGAQKAGTSSLFDYLSQHPSVVTPIVKEVHYFDHGYHRGERWYASHFPALAAPAAGSDPGATPVTFDASPYYVFHPDVAGRLKAYAPDAKLILLLRDPVARAWSQYWHERAKGYETLEPLAALRAEAERVPDPHGSAGASRQERYDHHHFAYVARSQYDIQLERWWSVFPRASMLVLKSEELFAAPEQVLAQATDFLGLPRIASGQFKPQNVGAYTAMPTEAQAWLEERLLPTEQALKRMLGERFTWDD